MFSNAKANQIVKLIYKKQIQLRNKTLLWSVLVHLVIITNKCKENYK
jgi:hypothetical protein